MHRVDFRVAQELIVIGVAFRDRKGVLDRLQLFWIALADCDQVRVRMRLVDRNEFSPKPEADDGDVDAFWHERKYGGETPSLKLQASVKFQIQTPELNIHPQVVAHGLDHCYNLV